MRFVFALYRALKVCKPTAIVSSRGCARKSEAHMNLTQKGAIKKRPDVSRFQVNLMALPNLIPLPG
jgi:hypothetical protein